MNNLPPARNFWQNIQNCSSTQYPNVPRAQIVKSEKKGNSHSQYIMILTNTEKTLYLMFDLNKQEEKSQQRHNYYQGYKASSRQCIGTIGAE